MALNPALFPKLIAPKCQPFTAVSAPETLLYLHIILVSIYLKSTHFQNLKYLSKKETTINKNPMSGVINRK